MRVRFVCMNKERMRNRATRNEVWKYIKRNVKHFETRLFAKKLF